VFRDINDEVFESDGDGLEDEEFERVVCQPFLEHEVSGEVEESRDEEGDVELSVGRSICTAGEVQKLVRNESSKPRDHLVDVESSERCAAEKQDECSYRSHPLMPRLPRVR